MKNPHTDQLLAAAKRLVCDSVTSEMSALAFNSLRKAIAAFDGPPLPGIADETVSDIICACDESANDMSARQ